MAICYLIYLYFLSIKELYNNILLSILIEYLLHNTINDILIFSLEDI